MTYTFSLQQGQAGTVSIPTQVDPTGYTLSLRVKQTTASGSTSTTISTGLVAGAESVTLTVSAANSTVVAPSYYQLLGTKNGVTVELQSGRIYLKRSAAAAVDMATQEELNAALSGVASKDELLSATSAVNPLWIANYDAVGTNLSNPIPPWNAIQYAKVGGVDVPTSISVVENASVPGATTDKFRPSGRALRVEVRPGDTGFDNGVPRAEVYARAPQFLGSTPAANWPDPVGSERWYGFSVFIPTSFTAATDTRRLSVMQIKGRDGGSPPINLEIKRGNWRLGGTRTDSGTIPNDGTLGPIVKGQWTRFVYGVKLATDNTGWVEVWKDGVLVRPRFNVATMDLRSGTQDPDPVYFKQGIYRDGSWTDTHTFHFGPAKVGATRASVFDPIVDSTAPEHNHDGRYTLSTGGGRETLSVNNAPGGTPTINLANGNVHRLTLNSNAVLSFSGATANAACTVTLILVQDSAGGRTVTWPASVKWAGGLSPSLATTSSAVNVVTLVTTDGGTTWYGFLSGADMR